MRNVNKQKTTKPRGTTSKLVKYSLIFVLLAVVTLLGSAFFAGAYQAIVVER